MGTVTVSCVRDAAVTATLVAPKKTMLLAGVVLKFVPVIVTVVPTAPLVGVKLVIANAFAPVAGTNASTVVIALLVAPEPAAYKVVLITPVAGPYLPVGIEVSVRQVLVEGL